MSARLRNPNTPGSPFADIELGRLIALVRRAYSLHLMLEVDRSAPDGKCIGLYNAFSRKLHLAFSDAAALQEHLDSVAAPDDTVTVIPRAADGALITASAEFRNVRLALRIKTGYAGLDCDKALRWADGNADRALVRLIETNGYASTKV